MSILGESTGEASWKKSLRDADPGRPSKLRTQKGGRGQSGRPVGGKRQKPNNLGRTREESKASCKEVHWRKIFKLGQPKGGKIKVRTSPFKTADQSFVI